MSLTTFTPLEVPHVDILTFAFEGEKNYDENKKIYFDADDDSTAMTGPQLITSVKKLIAGFKAAGVQPGDCVCLHLFNSHVYTSIYFAIIGCGAAYTGTNPAYTVFELSDRFQLCSPRVVITSPEHLATVQAACKGVPDSKIEIFVLDEAAKLAIRESGLGVISNEAADKSDGHEDVLSVSSLLGHGSSDWMRIADEKTARETTACLFPTSGTTGMPKLCRLSHHAEIAKYLSIQSEGKDYDVRTLVSIPLFHIFGAGLTHIGAIRTGDPVYLMTRFDLKKFVESIKKYGITDTAATPLMVVYLLKSGLPLTDLLASLRYIWCGSAPIDAAVLAKFYEVLPSKAIVTGLWGMSETGAQTYFQWPERDTTGSVGRLSPGTEIRLVDDSGKTITTDNTHGEALVRTTQIMTSYFANPSATHAAFTSSWLRTGDICYVSQGKWYVVGRAKDLIKVSGWQVAPAELEAVLLCHPLILDAAVVGVRTADGNEAPRGFIVRAPGVAVGLGDEEEEGEGEGEGEEGGGLGEKQVAAWMKERLAGYKRLSGGVVFVDAIPKNAMGKTEKGRLVDMFPYVA